MDLQGSLISTNGVDELLCFIDSETEAPRCEATCQAGLKCSTVGEGPYGEMQFPTPLCLCDSGKLLYFQSLSFIICKAGTIVYTPHQLPQIVHGTQ